MINYTYKKTEHFAGRRNLNRHEFGFYAEDGTLLYSHEILDHPSGSMIQDGTYANGVKGTNYNDELLSIAGVHLAVFKNTNNPTPEQYLAELRLAYGEPQE